MDFNKREQILRRITSRTLYCTVKYKHDNFDVVFKDPSLSILAESDWIYNKIFNRSTKEDGLFTLEESYKLLTEKGLWNDKLQKELETIKSDIEKLNSRLPELRFKKSEERTAKAAIEKAKKRFIELETIRNQLYSSTAEYLSDMGRKKFIVSKITEIKDRSLLEEPAFLDVLVYYYYKENGISEPEIREIARTDPWRLYWTVSKGTGTHLFPHSSVEMTDLQYLLLLWTKVYDFAFESSNRPSDEVINDDTKFDAWYKAEADRINKENQKRQVENSANLISGQEVFIPSDKEGAKEVYSLNDPIAKGIIATREKVINEKGQLEHTQLPDVKQDLIMKVNQAASQGTQNRR
jgi:hypothetical protein